MMHRVSSSETSSNLHAGFSRKLPRQHKKSCTAQDHWPVHKCLATSILHDACKARQGQTDETWPVLHTHTPLANVLESAQDYSSDSEDCFAYQ